MSCYWLHSPAEDVNEAVQVGNIGINFGVAAAIAFSPLAAEKIASLIACHLINVLRLSRNNDHFHLVLNMGC